MAAIERTIPLGRMADPVEVGNVAAFLASDLASYVSGASIACHGGGEPPAFLVVQKGLA
ncbi:SDR family oxidoreductase [Nocardioides sp.]|uniref:SDR family oxidoreductase n=1 Tax=Nocardioides sp. TaxID=35761 RepID=UPI002ED8647A